MKRRIQNIQTKTHALSVVTGKPRVAYDAVEYLNPSSIAVGLVDHTEINPTAIKWAFENPDRTTTAYQQDRMDRGTLTHLMLLQPERALKDVMLWEANKPRTRAKEGKEPTAYDQAVELAEKEHKLLICEEDHDIVAAAVKAFQFQPRIRELLTDLDAEVAMFSSEHSFYVKGMVDAVTSEREGVDGPYRLMIDLKTTEAGISKRAIETTIRNFNNREKMAAYRRWYAREANYPIEQIRCVNLFLSMVPPYGARVVDITTMALEWGEQRIVSALDAVQKCLDDESWPMLVRSGEAMVEEWEMDDDILVSGEAA